MLVNGHIDMQVSKLNNYIFSVQVFKLLLFYIFMIELIIRVLSTHYTLYQLTNVIFNAFYDVDIKTWNLFSFSLLFISIWYV